MQKGMQKSSKKAYFMRGYLKKMIIHSLEVQKCNVCFHNESIKFKQIYCQICHTNVHQVCYLHISEKKLKMPWRCKRCVHQIELKNEIERFTIKCKFCPHQWGSLRKFVNDDDQKDRFWAHLFCIQTNPNMYINQRFKKEDQQLILSCKILNKQAIFTQQIPKMCIYCLTSIGLPLKCDFEGCSIYFHTLCWICCSNYSFKFQQISSELSYKIYCDEHQRANQIKKQHQMNQMSQMNKNTCKKLEYA